jgi:uncharacterized membrane protein required for colicin V production
MLWCCQGGIGVLGIAVASYLAALSYTPFAPVLPQYQHYHVANVTVTVGVLTAASLCALR